MANEIVNRLFFHDNTSLDKIDDLVSRYQIKDQYSFHFPDFNLVLPVGIITGNERRKIWGCPTNSFANDNPRITNRIFEFRTACNHAKMVIDRWAMIEKLTMIYFHYQEFGEGIIGERHYQDGEIIFSHDYPDYSCEAFKAVAKYDPQFAQQRYHYEAGVYCLKDQS